MKPLIINAPEVTFQDRTRQEEAYATRIQRAALKARTPIAHKGANMSLVNRIRAWLNEEVN